MLTSPEPVPRRQTGGHAADAAACAVEVCDGVRGELVHASDGWQIRNEAEVQTLTALGGSAHALGWLRALTRTLDSGLVQATDIGMLGSRLQHICGEGYLFESSFADDDGLGEATVFACAHSDDDRLEWWLGTLLLCRLAYNVVNGSVWVDYQGNAYWHAGDIVPRYGNYGRARDVEAARCMARMPQTFWAEMRRHPRQWLRRTAAATDPQTPAQRLRHLVEDGHPHVLMAAAVHPNADRALQRRLLNGPDPSGALAAAVASRKRISRRLLRHLTRHDRIAQCQVALHPASTGKILAELAERLDVPHDPSVADALASNPATPPDALRRLARTGHLMTAVLVALNPTVPLCLLQSLAEHSHRAARAAAVGNLRLPLGSAAVHATDRSLVVRAALARRPDIPASILSKLAEDPKDQVRAAAAASPAAPADVLGKLARDSSSAVRREVASNERTPSNALARLARDSNRFVRVSLACNHGSPPELLAALVNDSGAARLSVAANPAAGASMLERLSAHRDWWVRASAAANPSTPQPVLKRLAHDETVLVRRPAARNLSRVQA